MDIDEAIAAVQRSAQRMDALEERILRENPQVLIDEARREVDVWIGRATRMRRELRQAKRTIRQLEQQRDRMQQKIDELEDGPAHGGRR